MTNLVKSNRNKHKHGSNNTKQNETNNANNPDNVPFATWFLGRFTTFIKSENAPQWTMVFLTIVIIIFAGISIVFTSKQISIFRDTTKIDLRAYINIGEFNFSITENDFITIHYNFINFGKTPANNVFESACVVQEDIVDSMTVVLSDIIKRRNKMGQVIGSNVTYQKTFKSDSIISPKKHREIINHQINLVFLGVVGYTDVFNERHHTWICFKLNPDNTFCAYNKYNNSD